MSARFDLARFSALVQARALPLGDPAVFADVTASTNDDAMQAARDDAPHGATWIADQQTAGRGRRGTRWSSPAGQSLLFSLLLRPRLEPDRGGGLTLAVGLAVRDAVAPRVAAPVLIKWPNDIVVRGRKLGGILLESQIQSGRLDAVIAGVGLNVEMGELPPEIADVATSLALLDVEDLERETLLADVLMEIAKRLDSYELSGLKSMLADIRRWDALDGRRVRIGEIEGIACGIDDAGALLVRDADGNVNTVTSGSVELV